MKKIDKILIGIFICFFIVLVIMLDNISMTGFIIFGGDRSEQIKDGTRWNHMPLTYDYKGCDDRKEVMIENAIDYVEEETQYIDFKKVRANPDVLFLCSSDEGKGAIVGEARSYIYNSKIISYGEILLYESYHCEGERPTIEIHEILHIIGLGHSDASDRDNIMNPYVTDCDAKISDEDVKYLNNLYRNVTDR